MYKGKIIVVEGTDCSGKQTQSDLLLKKLTEDGLNVKKFSFPDYESPTGKILGGPVLGKKNICHGYFPEGSSKIDPKVLSLYYAADRKYNFEKINKYLKNDTIIILDRYTYSNMAFQAAKLSNDKEKIEMFKWIEKLEFKMLELPKSDINIFLHMPTTQIKDIIKNREELPDQNEKDIEYLSEAEKTYFLMTQHYNFKTIECVKNNKLRTIDEINEELYNYVKNELKI